MCHVYVPRLLDVFLEKMGRAHKQISGHRKSYFKVFPRSSKILKEHSILSRNEGLCGILNARANLKGKIALPTLLVAAWTKLLGKQFLEINHNQN